MGSNPGESIFSDVVLCVCMRCVDPCLAPQVYSQERTVFLLRRGVEVY